MKLTSLGTIAIALSGIIAAGGTIDRANATTITLYDGAANTTPDNFSPQYLNFFSTGGTQTPGGGVTTLDTSGAESLQAGYTNYNILVNPLVSPPTVSLTSFVNPLFPILDSNAGYTLSFTININSQTNNGVNGANRAGFSAIVLDNNRKGIEIGFRNSDIFAQTSANFNSISPLEQKTASLNLLSNSNTYDLTVLGNNYSLTNAGNILFTGSLRDYTAAINPANPLTSVYGTANFLFLGDDTTSAGASVNIQKISLTTNTPVPEPSGLIGSSLAIGFVAILKRKLNRASKKASVK